MAERGNESPESSDSDVALVRPRNVKRRRILPGNLSASVPVYSKKVISCLKLLPNDTSALTHMEKELQRIQGSEDLESEVIPEPQPAAQKSPVYSFSDSEDEAKTNTERAGLECQRIRDASPSPPPTPEVAAHRRGRAYHKIREVDAQLKDLGTVLSPSRKSLAEETDVILVDSSPAPEITLKVRRRGEVFRINMRTREPLQRLVEAMASQLKVAPSQILLLLRDEELDTTKTPQSLHLTVADIIDCMVLSASDGQDPDQDGKICLKVQGKEKESHLSVFVEKTEPLQSLMDQYMAAMGLPKKTKISFIFEGQKLKGKSTAEELELETDDIIEVWL
ncbi:NFATC2-interacting protein-like [Spea bombifrons]|uniref:NFATC2-interacting protein-like n=1 Tax=Spea bombifrons TaxID=233779 RepID=UPI0023493F0C|nr:NFATC2-interacting protein-like [Spea bombifrons]